MQTMILGQYYASGIHIEINDLLNSSFNPFSTNVPLLYPLKTSENIGFLDVFREYRRGKLVENWLSFQINSQFKNFETIENF